MLETLGSFAGSGFNRAVLHAILKNARTRMVTGALDGCAFNDRQIVNPYGTAVTEG